MAVVFPVQPPAGGINAREESKTAKEALPFLAVTLAVLLLVTFVPDVALWLPETLGYLS